MSVNNVNNYQQYRKEYIRLSTAINRGRDKGLDMSELLTQREQLKSVYSSQQKPVYNNNSIQSAVNKVYKTQSVYKVNKVNKINEELTELKTFLSEQKTQLENINQTLTNIPTEIKEILNTFFQQQQNYFTEFFTTKFTNQQPKQPTEISVKKEPRKVFVEKQKLSNSVTQSASNKITFSYNKNILANIQSFLLENPHPFPSFSHFIREALLAYQNGMKIDEKEEINTSKKDSVKKSLRMNAELQNIYRTLPEGQKTIILNQILSAFLSSQT